MSLYFSYIHNVQKVFEIKDADHYQVCVLYLDFCTTTCGWDCNPNIQPGGSYHTHKIKIALRKRAKKNKKISWSWNLLLKLLELFYTLIPFRHKYLRCSFYSVMMGLVLTMELSAISPPPRHWRKTKGANLQNTKSGFKLHVKFRRFAVGKGLDM
jgi:hypothetical protein